MTRYEKIALTVILVSTVGLLIWLMLLDKPINCWNKYSTEREAIQNCEQHN
jgi:hypothetical protein